MLLLTDDAISSQSFFVLIGIGLAATSGAAINHVADFHIDSVMARTHNVPFLK